MKPSDKWRCEAELLTETVTMRPEKFEELMGELDSMFDVPPVPSFDWSQCPRDTVFEVEIGSNKSIRHFSQTDKHGNMYFYADGYSSLTVPEPEHHFMFHVGTHKFRLAHNPPRVWFGGKQPVPDDTRVKIWLRGYKDEGDFSEITAGEWPWIWHGTASDIIAYEILGDE